jgi:hypothetical protein
LLSTLPAIRFGNSFKTNTASNIGNQPTTHIFNGNIIENNLRQAPSNLALNITGSISPGVITVSGITLFDVFDIVYTVSSNSLKQDLSPVIKTYLNLNSNASVPGNIKVARIVQMERVITNTSLDVLSTINSYDIKGYHLLDNSFVKDESILDTTLKSTEIILPSTSNNINNVPNVGDRIKVRLYISTTGDSENVSFSKSGTLYTNKKFALVDVIAISSGFTSNTSSSATLVVNNMNQPATRSRYKSFYDYLGPKPNERITIDFNLDKIIGDATISVENTRPINADVLVKAAKALLVNVTINIVVSNDFIAQNSALIVQQNVQDAVTAALNAKALGTIVDANDLINTAYGVSGVDRARILYFNKNNQAGSVLSIAAQENEFIVANLVNIVIEKR